MSGLNGSPSRLLILGVALGLTGFLVDAEVPQRAVEWVTTSVESPIVFLLLLNVFLIAVGALIDIYSAIIIVVPLIVPLGAAFGIDPIHLATGLRVRPAQAVAQIREPKYDRQGVSKWSPVVRWKSITTGIV